MACGDMILSNDYADILIDYQLEVENYPELSVTCIVPVDPEFSIVYAPRSTSPPLSVTNYTYSSIPKLYGLMQTGSFDPISLIRSGILQVQRPPLSLTGRGVVLAFVDTGIRYQLDVFRREDGSTRLLAVWDQTIQDGEPPEGFYYGTEYTREQINAALESENPLSVVPTTDTEGHGTAMISVAAGSSVNRGLDFLGAAPDTDIVVVKCKEAKQYLRDYYLIPDGVPAYAESDLILAVKYLQEYAVTFRRPVVICIGMGTNMGDHAGNSIFARYLNKVAGRRSRAVVVCGGNEGNAAHHYMSILSDGTSEIDSSVYDYIPTADVSRYLKNGNSDVVEIRVGEGERGFLMEMWGSIPNIFSLSLRSPGGETIAPIEFRSNESRTFSFIYESTVITIGHILVEQRSGEQLILFRFQAPTPGVWTITVTRTGGNGSGVFHMWLPISGFLSGETYFFRSTPYVTLTEPSLAENVLTPSTYNDENNSFYPQSGRGFSRNGDIKPDFTAPGVEVPTALGRRTGSSLSAAITAGAAAQFMQWAVVEQNAPLIGTREIRNYFIRGAARDNDVVYPNRELGFGRLDLAGTFEALAGIGR